MSIVLSDLILVDLNVCERLLDSLGSVVVEWSPDKGTSETEDDSLRGRFTKLKSMHPPTEEDYTAEALEAAKSMLNDAYDIDEDFGDEVTDYISRMEDISGPSHGPDRQKAFMDAWDGDIKARLHEMATNKEVERAVRGKSLNKELWGKALGVLEVYLQDMDADESSDTRAKLRQMLEDAWKKKTVGRPGEKFDISTMPPKIWNVLQELLDARVVLKSSGDQLSPGGVLPSSMYSSLPLLDQERLAGKKPDFFATVGGLPGVGDAANVDTADLEEAVNEAVSTVTLKVSKYKPLLTVVMVGVHNAPKILEDPGFSEVNKRIKALHDKPAKVHLVSGGRSRQVYP